jgi:hypothetical protein
MGMIVELATLSDVNIDRLLNTPELIWNVLAPDNPDLAEEVPPEIQPLQFAEFERNEANLDKAWHGIHFLLTGTNWAGDPPLNFLVAGGAQVGDIDTGYGPARFSTRQRSPRSIRRSNLSAKRISDVVLTQIK